MGLEFNYVHANLDFNGQLINDVAVRYKGNGTWMESTGSIKRSLKIQLDHFTKGQSLASVSTLNLHNCVTDASFMNEVLSHKLFRDAQVPAPRTAYARVYVSVAGKLDRKYFGLYSMVEDIDATFTKETFARKGGAIFKPVTPFPFIDLGPNFDAYKQIYDPKTKLSDSEKQRLIEFCRLVSSADDAEFAANLPQYLDLDNFARFMAIEVYLSTLDSILSIGQNYYVYLHPKTNQFHFLPWDLDHSFGQFPMIGTQQQREQLSIHHPWRGDIRFLDRVYKVPAFKTLYLAKLDEFSKTIFIPDRFHKQVDDIAAAIRPAAQDESPVKFQRLNRVAAGQSPDGPGIADAFFGRGRGSLMDSRKPIKPFTIARSQSILDQLSGKSPGLSLPETGFGAPPPTPPAQDRGRIARTGINPQTRPASPSAFGPGNFLAPAFLAAFDSNKDNLLTRDELLSGFDNWFTSWNTDRSNLLTDEQLRIGLNKALIPPPPAPGSPTMIPLNAPPPSPPTR
ncbi:MAG: CotH kinase family protein [Planctomycetota bacterium]|nr:CotH kinase family protein [Planctomycetota bacterium]